MVSQGERRAATVHAIETSARRLFETRGFTATTIDDIGAKAGVAKGAVYHHFSSKEEIFTRVLEKVQEELATAQLATPEKTARDPLDLIAAGVLRYLLAISEPGIKQILLIDGPVVLGWEKWRAIDMHYFGALTKAALANALAQEPAAKDIETVAHLLMGAIMEAALVCSTAANPRKSARELSATLRVMLQGFKTKS
ncbi:MAG: TetR/AcrR family transcriptional regulator [Proteobacteria bacterium]|nr:TetR/AcrR family transcriptional regulator [Pseudomonadota bacterium]